MRKMIRHELGDVFPAARNLFDTGRLSVFLRCARVFCTAFLIVILLSACARHQSAQLWKSGDKLSGDTEAAFRSIAQNEDKIENLKAQGICIVAVPGVVGKRKLNTTLLFRKPDDLVVRGFDSSGLGGQVLRLVCYDGQLGFEMAGDRVALDELLQGIPPEYIARELLYPEDWTDLKRRKIRVFADTTEDGSSRLTFFVKKRFGYLRKVVLLGPDWRVSETELLDKNSATVISIKRDDYTSIMYENDKLVSVPLELRANFSLVEMELRFKFDAKRLEINRDMSDDDFVEALQEK